MSHLTITLHSSGERITCHPQDLLLDTLELNKVCVEYQCRAGYCGSCRTRLLKGAVCYAVPPLACIRPGEILLCCCRAQSDIEIDI